MDHEPEVRRARLRELARLFLKLGTIGFGGPAAHIALMRDEVVRRRGWLEDREFLDYVGATNLIPGPNSTELAIHLGQRRAGWRGLVVAGVCFILPAVLIVSVLAWLYARYGTDPAVVDLRYGILPVIIAVIAHAVYVLGRRALVTPLQVTIGAAAFVSFLVGAPELAILALAGLVGALWAARRSLLRRGTSSLVLAPFALRLAGDDPTHPLPVTLWRLFLVFLEIGSVLYGSGYVLVAFLQSHLVDKYGWLTSEQVLDAVTVGQITPGPVFTTATFVGWQVRGPWGAAVATVGIFLPAFVFVALLGRIVPWMRARPVAAAFLAGVTTASLGLMAGVLVQLAGDAVVDVVTALVALAALAVLVATRVNTMWLVGAGALIGVAHALLA